MSKNVFSLNFSWCSVKNIQCIWTWCPESGLCLPSEWLTGIQKCSYDTYEMHRFNPWLEKRKRTVSTLQFWWLGCKRPGVVWESSDSTHAAGWSVCLAWFCEYMQVWEPLRIVWRQAARDLARLPLDQSCCSHVRGIMLLSIPPYPAAQPAVTPGEQDPLLSLPRCCRRQWRVASLLHVTHSWGGKKGARCLPLRVIILTDEAWGCRPAHHEADVWDRNTTGAGSRSQQHHF